MHLARAAAAVLVALAAIANLVPTTHAWALAPAPPPPAASDVAAAWTTDLAPSAFPTSHLTGALGAATCALGDVTGDGIADLAVLVQAQGGSLLLEARAGPTFDEVVWRLSTTLERVLECAPDLDLDGTLDPIIRTAGDAAVTGAGAAADEARHVVHQTLDGASGAALVGRVVTETTTGVASNGVSAAQGAAATLLPAAEGAVALLEGAATGASLPVPVTLPESLPLDAVSFAASQTARLEVLDITGAVVATVEVAEAGVEPLALAPVQLSGALPDIAVLSQVTGPVQQAAAGVPELALYAADGTLAWSTQLPASTGLPILVPNAGDLDLDGVGDLIVTTVQQPLSAAPGAAYTVLSGVDGSILFGSGPAVEGLVSALPLGDLANGPAVLEATLANGAGQIALRALGGTGQVLWSADVDALAEPVNVVLDPYTRDVLGFTDLTGDAVADVAVATVVNGTMGDLQVQALDGLTGDVAWSATIADAQRLIPVVIGPAQLLGAAAQDERDDQAAETGGTNRTTAIADLPGLEGLVDGVEEAGVGQASLLLAIGRTQADAVLTLVEGTTGQVLWTATAQLPAAPVAQITAEVAGDLTGDRIQDLLVTARLNATGGAAGFGTASTSPPAVVAAVDGARGETVWSDDTSSSASGERLDFDSEFGPAASDEAQESSDAPGLAPVAWLVAVAVLAAVLRRRR